MKRQQEIATPKSATFEDKQVTQENQSAEEKLTAKTKPPLWKRLLFSGALTNESRPSQKIAYIAVIAAFLSVANLFEIKFADVQFSFTVAVSALSGVILGATFGFVASFLGDLVGFLFNSGGFAYMPWVGIALAVTAFLAGVIVGGIDLKVKGSLLIKITILALASFFISTVGINTTAFWASFNRGVPYLTYAVTRIFVGGQIYNCLVNYALLYIIIPIIAKLKIVNFNY